MTTKHPACSTCDTGIGSCGGVCSRPTISVHWHNPIYNPNIRRDTSNLQRTHSLTDIHSSARAPSPLRPSAGLGSATAGQVCESSESTHLSGVFHYPTQSIQTPSTIEPNAMRTIPITPANRNSAPASITPTTIQPLRILVALASAISPVPPVRKRGFFGRLTTNSQAAVGVVSNGVSSHNRVDDDPRTGIGPPEEDMDHKGPGGGGGPGSSRLPPIQALHPMASQPIYTGPATISQDVLLYRPAGVTPAPAELQRNNVNDKLPPVPAFAPSRQATFFGIQNIPVADGTTRLAKKCAPGVRPVPAASTRPAYPPAGLASLVAGYQGLRHGGLTTPIERGHEATEWRECQRARERADIVVKDGELGPEEHAGLGERISHAVATTTLFVVS